jgi:hypothetical protein
MKALTGKKRRSSSVPRTGPATLRGTEQAKRQAAVLLEVLSGLRGPQDGSQVLGISLNRYYQLETRALQGFITALEPRPKGRQQTPEGEIKQLRGENERLTRDLSRSQALLRAAQRSLGLPRAAKGSNGSKLAAKGKTIGKGKRRVRTVRASKAIAALRATKESESISPQPAEASS